MKLKEIAQKTDKELATLVNESRKQINDLVIEARTKESKNVKAILAARKQLARALTIERQRAFARQGQTNE